MRTTTKRVLSTPFWILGLLFSPFVVLGVAYEFLKLWFNAGRDLYKKAQGLWDPKNNDPEFRRGAPSSES